MSLSASLILGSIAAACAAFLVIAARGRRTREGEEDARIEATYVRCRNMVADFGALMEKAPVSPVEIVDAGRLPHPKDELAAAFRLVIRATKDEATLAHLRTAALELAQYQEGVGPPPLRQINLLPPAEMQGMTAEMLAKAVLKNIYERRWDELGKKVDADIERISMAVGISRQVRLARQAAVASTKRTLSPRRASP